MFFHFKWILKIAKLLQIALELEEYIKIAIPFGYDLSLILVTVTKTVSRTVCSIIMKQMSFW